MQLIRKVSWWVFGLLCVSIGLYPLVYFAIDREFGLLASKSQELLNDTLWNVGFYGHILLGGAALFVGWLQFNKRLRTKRMKLHRRIGKFYTIAVLISGTCGVFIAFHATGGIISKLGFIMLGLVWLGTTIKAYTSIRNGQVQKHEIFMIYSYAACFAAVTLRIWLPILTDIMGDFIPAYRIVAWVCWVPNLIVAWFFINKKFGVAME